MSFSEAGWSCIRGGRKERDQGSSHDDWSQESMLFSTRYNFLFVHIAKTAGTSIQTALKKLRRRDPLSYPQLLCYNISKFFDNRIGCKIPRHGRVVTAFDMLPREVFEKLFKFTFIRNPWDIQVSSYYHTMREMPDLVKEHQFENFGDFLRWSLDPERPYEHWFEQLNQNMIDYMVNLDGGLLIDYVGRFECLEDDWGEICNRIGIPIRELPKKRISQGRGDYREYYDDELAALVANHYHRDIEAFGYTFDQSAPAGPVLGEVQAEYRQSSRLESSS